MPVLATEQYPKGLGHIQPEVAEGFPAGTPVIEKMSMSCCGQPAFVDRLRALGRTQVVVCGIEAHACVNQTVHDLLDRGYQVHVPYDAISARSEHDYRIGWEKIIGSGAVPSTVEMVVSRMGAHRRGAGVQGDPSADQVARRRFDTVLQP